MATEPTLDEQALRQRQFVVRRSRLPEGLPIWFEPRDLDGDGQLTMAEFAPRMTHARMQQFNQNDLNGDGLITTAECLRALKTKSAALKSSGRD